MCISGADAGEGHEGDGGLLAEVGVFEDVVELPRGERDLVPEPDAVAGAPDLDFLYELEPLNPRFSSSVTASRTKFVACFADILARSLGVLPNRAWIIPMRLTFS